MVKVVIVEICEANKLNVIDVEKVIEGEFPDVAVMKNTCLSLCGLCKSVPFALVNHTIVHGKTPEQCLEKIKKQIKKELANFYD